MDYYGILNIGRNASQEEIKRAYRKLSRKYHPDNAGEQYREQFDSVQEAYGVLGDEEKRTAYDERLKADEAGGGSGRTADRGINKRQGDKQEDFYKDLAAFYSGAYKSSFDNFFKKGMEKPTEQKNGAKPVNTDKLFESFFKFK